MWWHNHNLAKITKTFLLFWSHNFYLGIWLLRIFTVQGPKSKQSFFSSVRYIVTYIDPWPINHPYLDPSRQHTFQARLKIQNCQKSHAPFSGKLLYLHTKCKGKHKCIQYVVCIGHEYFKNTYYTWNCAFSSDTYTVPQI